MKNKLIKIGSIIAVVIVFVTMTVVPAFAWTYDDPDIEVVTSTSMPTSYRSNVIYVVTLDSTNEWAGQWLFNTTLTDIPSVSTNYRFMYTVGSEETVRNSITLSLAGVMKYDDTNAYVDGTWNMSRYITILSEASANFLVWLKANARRLTTPTVKVTNYYLYIDGEAVQFPTLIDAVNYLYQGTAEDYINGAESGNRDLYYELEGYLNSIYQDGSDDGYFNGYEAGELAGYREGYTLGYAEGKNVTDSENFGENLLGSTLSAPMNALNSFVIYEANGITISLGMVVGAMLSLLVFLGFLKLFGGG